MGKEKHIPIKLNQCRYGSASGVPWGMASGQATWEGWRGLCERANGALHRLR